MSGSVEANSMDSNEIKSSDSDVQSPDFGNQRFRLVPEGIPLSGSNQLSGEEFQIPNQYDTRIGGGTTAGIPPAPPVFTPTPERRPDDGNQHSHRKAAIFGGLGTAVAGAAAAAAIFFGGDRSGSQNQNPDTGPKAGGVVTTIPTIESTQPPFTVTPTATNTAEATQIPEATPTPNLSEAPKSLADYPEKIGYSMTTGSVSIAITEGVQQRDTNPLHEILLNTKDFPNGEAEQKLEEGTRYGLFMAWQREDDIPDTQKDLIVSDTDTPEQRDAKFAGFEERAKGGEQFIINTKVNQGSDNEHFNTSTTEIDAGHTRVNFVFVNTNNITPDNYRSTQLVVQSDFEIGYRLVDGELFVELYAKSNPGGFGVGVSDRVKYNVASAMSWGLTLLNRKNVDEKLSTSNQYTFSGAELTELNKERFDIDRYLIPVKNGDDWDSPLSVK